MEIKREKYLNEIIERKNNNLIKVITGLRRSGKSVSSIDSRTGTQ